MPAKFLKACGTVHVTVSGEKLNSPGFNPDETRGVARHDPDSNQTSVKVTSARLSQETVQVKADGSPDLARTARHELGHAYEFGRRGRNQIDVADPLRADLASMSQANKAHYSYFAHSSREAVAESISHLFGPTADGKRFSEAFPLTMAKVEATLKKRGHVD
jgi:hypothetical protein